jgi:hypothetical protein
MTQPSIIVVAGAQGNLGKLVCEGVIERARREGRSIEVRGLLRRTTSAAPPGAPIVDPAVHQRLVFHAVDYGNPADLARVCEGASCVVSTLQGLGDVIVDVQAALLAAALRAGVRRFIPSDFSGDFTRLPEGSHRNFDLRRTFHQRAEAQIAAASSGIEFTSIFQGGFTELLGSGWVLFDYHKRRVNYFGSADAPMEFTTWKNTAEFTAAVALDERPTPRYLYPAGQRVTPREAVAIARKVTGAEFTPKRVMPTALLRWVIQLIRLVRPGRKGEVMPLWVAMQYGYCGALGVMSPVHLDNDRYPDIVWQGIDSVVLEAFVRAGEKS